MRYIIHDKKYNYKYGFDTKTGLCSKAGIGCYQSGMLVEKLNMTVDSFRMIAEQSKGECNQFALGGRDDPDMG